MNQRVRMRPHGLLLGALALALGGSASMARAGQAPAPASAPVLEPPAQVEPAKPVEFGKPDHVIGSGSPESVTEEALRNAVAKGGTIVFNTGGKPLTLHITQTLLMSQRAKPAVLDGLGLVTLDGGGKHRILQKEWKTELTVQRLRFQHARGDKDGAAIWGSDWDGRLTVIDCQFEDCKTTVPDHDIGGGAIRVRGQRHLLVSGCSFTDCEGGNGGAICTIGCQMTIINCSFLRNRAFGYGGGADAGPTGHGGIGGAVYIDGVDQNAEKKQLYMANCLFKDNRAGDHAGAVFGYTRPRQDSLSVYLNCIFENNSVDEPKDKGWGCVGALYSQHSRLHVLNCTFADNKAKKYGALFTAVMESEHIANCEFHGNAPEFRTRADLKNVTFTRRDVPPAVAALGRMPGPLTSPAAKAATTQSKAVLLPASAPAPGVPPAPAAAAPAPAIDAAKVAAWDDRLRAALREALQAGQTLKAGLRLFGAREGAKVCGIAEVGEAGLSVVLEGNRLPVRWVDLGPADRASLAMALPGVAEEDPRAMLLAAVYLAGANRTAQADDYFAKASLKDATAVQAARESLGLSK